VEVDEGVSMDVTSKYIHLLTDTAASDCRVAVSSGVNRRGGVGTYILYS
jgi:hypothetical protein